MAKLLMKLHQVPEDEAQEVRDLLAAAGIEYFETPADRWGVSMPALWVSDAGRWQEARALLDGYQRERQAHARAAYRQALAEGESHPSLLARLLAHPLQTLLVLALVAVVLYLSLMPFLMLG